MTTEDLSMCPCITLAPVVLFNALALVTAPLSADAADAVTRLDWVCQLQGEVGPLAADHPAAAFAGFPVTSHVTWVSTADANGKVVSACADGEISLSVGGTLRVSPIGEGACTLTHDPSRLTGRLELSLPDSPFSPMLFAFSGPWQTHPAKLTGLDELVIAGDCHMMSEEPAKQRQLACGGRSLSAA